MDSKNCTENPKGLEQLHFRYERMVYKLTFRIVGNSWQAEKVVLRMFSQVWEGNGEVLQTGQRLSV